MTIDNLCRLGRIVRSQPTRLAASVGHPHSEVRHPTLPTAAVSGKSCRPVTRREDTRTHLSQDDNGWADVLFSPLMIRVLGRIMAIAPRGQWNRSASRPGIPARSAARSRAVTRVSEIVSACRSTPHGRPAHHPGNLNKTAASRPWRDRDRVWRTT